ncbi:MAG: hypothetical protein RBS37_09780 [Bacteroidales bacterium]|jgi:hypothetical protein|nr:hypothetical protein [Bacteroidales bacterium]
MNKISAFKCDYCGKVYTTSKSCKAHEKNCYYNPDTRSCASCEHLGLEKKYLNPGEYSRIQVCKAGIRVNESGLQSDCSLYCERKEEPEEGTICPETSDCRTETSGQSFVSSSLRVLADNN